MDNTAPSFVQTLVPYAGCVGVDFELAGFISDEADTLVKDALPEVVLHEIHLMDEAENDGGRTILLKSFDDPAIGDEVALELARLNVKDVD